MKRYNLAMAELWVELLNEFDDLDRFEKRVIDDRAVALSTASDWYIYDTFLDCPVFDPSGTQFQLAAYRKETHVPVCPSNQERRKQFGEYLRGCRAGTLRELAKKMNISASYLSDVENGKRSVTLDMIQRFIIAIDCGYGVQEMYDTMIKYASLMTPEREFLIEINEDCLTMLTVPDWFKAHLHDALYGDLERRIKKDNPYSGKIPYRQQYEGLES